MDNNLLSVAFVFLLAAVIAVPLAQRLGMGSVLGYLLAGIVIGPWGLGLVRDVDAILHFAEFGVVLLLFLIGLELNPKKLLQMRRPIIGLGGSQVVVTALFIGVICALAGLTLSQALVIGVGLALSSTAIAMKIIEDQRLMRSETGQAGFAVLLFQDIAVIPMLAMIPALAGGSAGSWLDVLWMFVGIGILLVGGHFLLRPLFRLVAMSGVTELFTVTSLALVIGIALAMQALGLSMALGAFLAGVLLAESEYRHELETAIEPFKGLLLGLFFIAVGMTVDLGLLLDYPLAILGAVTALILVKTLLLYGLARAFGVVPKARSQMAVLLSQGGEFAFVIFNAARNQGLLDQELNAFLLVVVSLSMMTTPLMLTLQQRWFARTFNEPEDAPPQGQFEQADARVIIAGFGRFGQVVGRLMFANKIGVTILERDPTQIKLLRRFGYEVYYGDATQLDLLRAAGAHTAEAIVICTDSPDEVMEIVDLCARHFPNLKVMARARSRVEAYQLMAQGVDQFSRETFLGALELGRQTLESLGMHPYKAKRAEILFRKLDMRVLQDLLPQHSEDLATASRVKEARKELEEIFDREMRGDSERHQSWNRDE
ncbi:MULTISPECIES: glutathione-regulated potassium-efflux system protein KefB [unclassified Salinivibrio]|uniref:glutathione-regulated potassium-efflux system protein KefB n=1 Tax=unclassified Salinivibrio TaxID=2636825 RepID=UPI00128AEA65|nr:MULTISPECIES: glutathione-regulated potassium-efflux system protein KefB [unclassified Salinivibrio]MPS32726.1 glutathione-regulated potassium-efflux system protein KefB [Salinivibrio sp. VYel7]MPX94116.1 glutathione-regulated potassium-efflux system protein KefB [Salinivibrio sp. VYel9]MPX96824.1 glutathione-regulated potassium-efflux system protein KefB [Salinivibrio sp. VYel6]MPY00024.1 glutathione-regulated potassium-efflux system protein KefB [Salinivibrio sp. VYel4]MPY03092.1 glutathi